MTDHRKEPKRGRTISRKAFLGAAGTGVAAAAIGIPATATARPKVNADRVRERRADVVVAGSGMGGLTAAVRAQRAGADVVLLEKAAEPGGTMRESAGSVHGGVTSYEEMREAVPWGDADLQRALAEGLPRAFEFFESVGAPIGPPGANPLSRSIGQPPIAFTNFMVSDFEAQGGSLLTETPLLRLLINSRNEVIGVLADGPGGPVRILANAVVLATGGWAGNAQMVNQHLTRDFPSLHQRNCGFGGLQPPLTGDGILAALELGAAPSDGGFDSFYGHLLPARPASFSHPLINYSMYHGQWCVCVNLRGERFTDESRGKLTGLERRPRWGREEHLNMEVARQPNAAGVYIWDHEINQTQALAEHGLGDIDKFEAFRQAGAPVAKADTVQELADLMERWGRGIPAEHVVHDIYQFNEAATNGKAWALPVPKQDSEFAVPLTRPPYYAVLGQTGITGSHGALKVNPDAQVLSRTGRPIQGLYAAGIDIGNIGNYIYLGFLGYGAAFGVISGENAARQPDPEGGWETVSM